MKKFVTILIFLLFLTSLQARAERPLGPEEFTSVDEVALAIASYFPRVQGQVQSLQGDRLTLGIGRRDGVLPGMVLSLWREGRELLHPVTKAVLGRAEEEVGAVEVVSVAESSSVAVIKRKVKEPAAGDRVRISPRKLNLGLIPLRNDRPEIVQGLIDRLNDLGRFSVLDPKKTEAFLKGRRQRDTQLVADLISAEKLDAAAAVGFYPVEDKLLVVVQVFFPEDIETATTMTALLTLASKREALGDVRPFFMPEKSSAETMPDLPIAARYVGVADLDGDGAAEYVFSDETRLHVLRPDAAGWKEVWTETVPGGEQGVKQFHVDVADVNGNGTPEIYVCRMVNNGVSTVVTEYRNGAFTRIADTPGFLRVLAQPGRSRVLIGQDFDPASFYAGPVREYAWSGDKPAAGKAIELPKGMNIFGFAFVDFGEARPLLVAFDRDSKLAVYTGDTVLWKSEEKYQAVGSTVIKPLSGLDRVVGRSASDLDKTTANAVALSEKDREVHISGDILTIDIDGNGTDELVLPRNAPNPLFGGYKDGEIQSLAWTGSRLEPRWSVKDLKGPVLDIRVLRLATGSAKIVALVQVPGGLFSKDAYRVETYEGK